MVVIRKGVTVCSLMLLSALVAMGCGAAKPSEEKNGEEKPGTDAVDDGGDGATDGEEIIDEADPDAAKILTDRVIGQLKTKAIVSEADAVTLGDAVVTDANAMSLLETSLQERVSAAFAKHLPAATTDVDGYVLVVVDESVKSVAEPEWVSVGSKVVVSVITGAAEDARSGFAKGAGKAVGELFKPMQAVDLESETSGVAEGAYAVYFNTDTRVVAMDFVVGLSEKVMTALSGDSSQGEPGIKNLTAILAKAVVASGAASADIATMGEAIIDGVFTGLAASDPDLESPEMAHSGKGIGQALAEGLLPNIEAADRPVFMQSLPDTILTKGLEADFDIAYVLNQTLRGISDGVAAAKVIDDTIDVPGTLKALALGINFQIIFDKTGAGNNGGIAEASKGIVQGTFPGLESLVTRQELVKVCGDLVVNALKLGAGNLETMMSGMNTVGKAAITDTTKASEFETAMGTAEASISACDGNMTTTFDGDSGLFACTVN